jgi:AP-3 complex subunit mu
LLHVDAFNEALQKSTSAELDPILNVSGAHGPSACCHIGCGNLRILAPVSTESMSFMNQRYDTEYISRPSLVDPLFVFAFLQRFADVLQSYLGEVSSSTIKDNFDVVYQVGLFNAGLQSSEACLL